MIKHPAKFSENITNASLQHAARLAYDYNLRLKQAIEEGTPLDHQLPILIFKALFPETYNVESALLKGNQKFDLRYLMPIEAEDVEFEIPPSLSAMSYIPDPEAASPVSAASSSLISPRPARAAVLKAKSISSRREYGTETTSDRPARAVTLKARTGDTRPAHDVPIPSGSDADLEETPPASLSATSPALSEAPWRKPGDDEDEPYQLIIPQGIDDLVEQRFKEIHEGSKWVRMGPGKRPYPLGGPIPPEWEGCPDWVFMSTKDEKIRIRIQLIEEHPINVEGRKAHEEGRETRMLWLQPRVLVLLR